MRTPDGNSQTKVYLAIGLSVAFIACATVLAWFAYPPLREYYLVQQAADRSEHGDLAGELTYLEALAHEFPSKQNRYLLSYALITQAIELSDAGDMKGATEIFDRAMGYAYDDPGAYHKYACMLIDNDNIEGAAFLLSRAEYWNNRQPQGLDVVGFQYHTDAQLIFNIAQKSAANKMWNLSVKHYRLFKQNRDQSSDILDGNTPYDQLAKELAVDLKLQLSDEDFQAVVSEFQRQSR
ncbi:hypothetical protein CA54_35900 [Symmachiella macrocystis]|uniref:Tetratricopeptide repeat protein n=1 Tax=Symmachiella macrocystis TaxID=2527985 RepID=A0A5C6BTC5_9PLAN|nr:hypothetical protein [Symmachiella macrocystis]TWU14721.1 hypothetical protein CA54_35900 [Symmachiella macrocystis]